MGHLNDLARLGQAVWLDFVDRKFLAEGGLQKLVEADALTGVTSNPSIFEKAMGHGDAYDEELAAYDKANPDAPTMDRYEHLAILDIQAAADTLRPVYERLESKDGYVSLEVSPYLANDTDATIAEAQKLWAAVGRPNLMIKIPGTPAGVPAIAATIDAGINVNVTLLFSQNAYQAVAEAYVMGLEKRAERGEPIDRIASVASFFVSRIDSKIDDKIDALVKAGGADGEDAKALKGKVAIANAKLAYAWYEEFIASARWQALAAKGAQPQRLLWASTGTKNPDYPDTLYLDSLIGKDTVNTVPPKTLDAFRDHGTAAATLGQDVAGARHVLSEAERLGLDLDGVTDTLVEEGVASFSKAFDDLLGAIPAKHPAHAWRISHMKIGIIGLGRMGAGIARRLMRAGHETVVFDRDEKAIAALASDGAVAATGLDDMRSKLGQPGIYWVMLPAGDPTEQTIAAIGEFCGEGDIVIDGGNTFYKDDIRRAKALAEKGTLYVDVGTSGGVWGLERGFCMMVGGDKAAVDTIDPILAALAPGIGTIPRTPDRNGENEDPRAEQGYIHAGPAGSGHFVKMVHNGIEYGLMQAYAEGFDILASKNSDKLPEDERFDLNLTDIAEVWRRGSVISSWLLDLSASALAKDQSLEHFTGKVADSGEGHWTIEAAMEEAVPVNVLSAALFARYRSRVDHTFGDKLLSAMRFGFGGHVEMPQ